MNQYTQQFEWKKRDNGTYFYCIKEDEGALYDLIHSIHEEQFYGCLPDDWVYGQIYNAFEALEDHISDDDFDRACTEIQTDVYTNDLLEWAKWPIAREYIQQGIDDFGNKGCDLDKTISLGQHLAIEAIYRRVWEFLQAEREET